MEAPSSGFGASSASLNFCKPIEIAMLTPGSKSCLPLIASFNNVRGAYWMLTGSPSTKAPFYDKGDCLSVSKSAYNWTDFVLRSASVSGRSISVPSKSLLNGFKL